MVILAFSFIEGHSEPNTCVNINMFVFKIVSNISFSSFNFSPFSNLL